MEIKRCPFCGGNDFDVTPESAYYNMRRDYKLSRVTITCKACEAEMHRVDDGEEEYYREARRSLITAWNTRVAEVE